MNSSEAMERSQQSLENRKNEEYEYVIRRISNASLNYGCTYISLSGKLEPHTIEKLELDGYYVGERRVFVFHKRGYVSWNGKVDDVSTYEMFLNFVAYLLIFLAACYVYWDLFHDLFTNIILQRNPHN